MNNNILHVELSYSGPEIDLSYFNGAKVENARNTLMIFDIHNTYNSTVVLTNNEATDYHTDYTYIYGLYWVNSDGNAFLVNTPYYTHRDTVHEETNPNQPVNH